MPAYIISAFAPVSTLLPRETTCAQRYVARKEALNKCKRHFRMNRCNPKMRLMLAKHVGINLDQSLSFLKHFQGRVDNCSYSQLALFSTEREFKCSAVQVLPEPQEAGRL